MAHSQGMDIKNLQNRWARHDWQVNPFAPTLNIVQALTGGKTASGAGFSRFEALMRCYGETAEILALEPEETSNGMAAGPDFAFAAQKALAERLERWALWEWWAGTLKALPLAMAPPIQKLRRKATRPRHTRLWYLAGFPHIHVVIARSHFRDGSQPLLGFGADQCMETAANSAAIELGLMELNLIEPPASLAAYCKRLEHNAATLFPAPRACIAPLPAKALTPAESLTAANVKFSLQDRTPQGLDMYVVKASIEAAPRWHTKTGPLL